MSFKLHPSNPSPSISSLFGVETGRKCPSLTIPPRNHHSITHYKRLLSLQVVPHSGSKYQSCRNGFVCFHLMFQKSTAQKVALINMKFHALMKVSLLPNSTSFWWNEQEKLTTNDLIVTECHRQHDANYFWLGCGSLSVFKYSICGCGQLSTAMKAAKNKLFVKAFGI